MSLLKEITRINTLSENLEGVQELIEYLGDDERILQALSFASRKHEGQVRKYNGLPYVSHVIAVASIAKLAGLSTIQIVGAILHDTVEDTDATIEQIQEDFGISIAIIVEGLTDISKPEDGNRTVRKGMDREHTANACVEVQDVKLCDLIHNSFSIVQHDSDFAKVYLKEKMMLLDVMNNGHADLHAVATQITSDGLYTLNGAAKSAAAFVEAS